MSLEQIGQQLRSARDSSGLSLAQIHERTKIPYGHLQAIDNGQVEDLPEPVYVTGFIKRYAECVGLDGQKLAEQYKLAVEGNGHSKGAFPFLPNKPKEPAFNMPVPAPVYYKSSKIERPAPNILKSIPFYAFWLITVLTLVTYLVSTQQNKEASQQDPSVMSIKDTAEKLKTSVPPTATGLPDQTNLQGGTEPTADADARITILANRGVWVEVKSTGSGDTIFAGNLERGDRKDFQDPQGLRVRATEGASLTVEQSGKSQIFGAPGKAAERTFMAKGANPDQNVDGKTAKDTASGITSATSLIKKPAVVVKKPTTPAVKTYKRVEGGASHREMPGESVNIDVPYRY
jgi:cytoskeletal protein RodZ